MNGEHKAGGGDSSSLLYDVETVGRLLGNLGRTSIYKLFKEGKLQPVKVFDRTMVTDEELRRFVAGLAQEAA